MRRLRLLRDSCPDPALDVALSRAVLERVAAGELPETLRLARPAAMVAFGKQDVVSGGYAVAADAAKRHGFAPVVRLGGGRAAVFHEGTVELAHAIPDPDPRAGIRARFERSAGVIAAALRRLGVDARVGEVPGEYCPGGFSVNARGRVKLVGVAQRVIAGGAHVGAVVVAERAEAVREVLLAVYEALGLDWDPGTVAAVADEAPGASLADVLAALEAEYAERYELFEGALEPETLTLARRLADAAK